MGRPRTINPTGDVVKVTARISADTMSMLKERARRRDVTLGQIVREVIEKGLNA